MFLPSENIKVDYLYCQSCGFCFAPDLWAWPADQFKLKIYNSDYVKVDPDYAEKRPHSIIDLIEQLFGSAKQSITHLDFGGGNGVLSQLMASRGWTTHSYDPMEDIGISPSSLGRYDLVTAIEVFEHVPDVEILLDSLQSISHQETVIFFTTVLSDRHIHPKRHLDWWYAAPRNGHISLFSYDSLTILLEKHGLRFHTLSEGFHCAFKQLPPWAKHIRYSR